MSGKTWKSWLGSDRVSRGERCSFLLHRGSWPERYDIQGSSVYVCVCVCVCVCGQQLKRAIVSVCVTFTSRSVTFSCQMCVEVSRSDPWWRRPSLSPCTGSFTVMPQVAAFNLTTAAQKENIRAAAMSISHKPILILADHTVYRQNVFWKYCTFKHYQQNLNTYITFLPPELRFYFSCLNYIIIIIVTQIYLSRFLNAVIKL